MFRRKPVLPLPDRLAEQISPSSTSGALVVIEPPQVARARAIAVLTAVPAQCIPTKSVLDTYLDAIGLGA